MFVKTSDGRLSASHALRIHVVHRVRGIVVPYDCVRPWDELRVLWGPRHANQIPHRGPVTVEYQRVPGRFRRAKRLSDEVTGSYRTTHDCRGSREPGWQAANPVLRSIRARHHDGLIIDYGNRY